MHCTPRHDDSTVTTISQGINIIIVSVLVHKLYYYYICWYRYVHSLYTSRPGHSCRSMILLFGPRLLSMTLRQLNLFNVASRTMRLPGLNSLSYGLISLKRVNLHSLERRRLYTDLIYCYKMLFGLGLIDIQVTDFFEWTPNHNTRGHNFKLYKKSCTMRLRVRSTFLVSVSSMSGIIYLPVWILSR